MIQYETYANKRIRIIVAVIPMKLAIGSVIPLAIRKSERRRVFILFSEFKGERD